MLYIYTVIIATITRLRVSSVHPARNEALHAPGIKETQRFSSGIENYVDEKQIREFAQTWIVNLS